MNHGRSEKESHPASELIARDQYRLLGHAGLSVTGQCIALAAGLLCTIVTVRLLEPSAYGRFAIFFMLLEIISHLLIWPNLGLVRFGREELGRTGSLAHTFWARLALFAICVLAAAGLLATFRQQVEAYLKLEYAPYLLLLFYVILNGFTLMAQSVFQTVSRFRAYAVAQASVKILNLAFILVLFVLLQRSVGPGRIIAVHIASFGIASLICLSLLPWTSLLPVRTSLSALGRIAAYSWPLLPAGLSALVVNWVDFVVIRHYWSEAKVGLYAASYQPVTVIIALQVALLAAVIPLLVSLVIEKRRETLIWYLDEGLPQIAWTVGLGGVLLAMAAEAIPLVLGQRYQASIVPCQVLTCGVAVFVFAGFQSALAKALDKVQAMFVVGLLTACLNALFDLSLVPRFGIRGAGIATTAAFLLSGLLYFPILNSKTSLRGMRPFRRYGALCGLVFPLIMASAALAFEDRATRLGCGLGIIVAWAFLARLTGVFRMNTLEKTEGVHMPAWTRKAMATFYAVFGR